MREAVQWIVTATEDAARLDTFLAAHLPLLARREIGELIATGQVRLNGQPGKKGRRVRTGDMVSVWACLKLSPNRTLPLGVLYVDAAIVGLDKPAGIPSLAVRMSETDTVANFLVAHFPDTATVSPRALEAGIVHRLDTATSGVLVAARTTAAYTALRAQFRAHIVEKQYLVLVRGCFQTSGSIRFSLAPEGPRGYRMRVVPTGQGQEALSTYTPVDAGLQCTLVRVTTTTGVRHQIRAHLAALGHPLVGDSLYGTAEQTPRLALHAEAVTFLHPTTDQPLRVASPLPHDFLAT